MRARVATLGALTALFSIVLVLDVHAQTTTTTRGAFGGVMSGDMTPGGLRGAVSPGAAVGAARGSLPVGATVGAVTTGAPVSPGGAPLHIGGFFVPVPLPAGTPVGPSGVVQSGVISFRGPVAPDAATATGVTGAMGAPVPSGTVLGPPGSAEIAERLQTESRMWLREGNYVQGEVMLNRSVAIREELAGGPNHPEVAQALEDNAKTLRVWNRDAAASDMEARAKEIRTKLEPPTPPKASPAPKAATASERF
jgi:hypothetical protein